MVVFVIVFRTLCRSLELVNLEYRNVIEKDNYCYFVNMLTTVNQVSKKAEELLGVQTINSSPYHPQSNESLERRNQTVKRMINDCIKLNNGVFQICLC